MKKLALGQPVGISIESQVAWLINAVKEIEIASGDNFGAGQAIRSISGLGNARNVQEALEAADTAITAAQAASQPLDATLTAIAGTGLQGHLYGLTLSNNGTDATNDIDIAAGHAADATGAMFIELSSGLTKRLDAAWAVGDGNGGLDTGSIANTTYFVWLIKRSDTGVQDALFSTSATSPTMPANYDYKRRIGAFVRASGAIIPFHQVGDTFWLKSQAADYGTSNPGTSPVTATLPSIPNGIDITILGAIDVRDASPAADTRIIVTSPDLTAVSPSTAANFLIANGGVAAAASGLFEIFSNSNEARYELSNSDAGIGVNIVSRGWIDHRGRLA